MKSIVIASTNVHKVREIREMSRNLQYIDFTSLRDFPDYIQVEESADTCEGNAILKAEHAAKTLNQWVLAEDSGLFVPILSGAPGVNSRRYASEKATDLENRQKLLDALKGMRGIERSAYFECCFVLASPKGVEKIAIGRCEGYIADKERGNRGFGYDSIFIKNEYSKTFAELEESQKNQISHRWKAFQKMLTKLEAIHN